MTWQVEEAFARIAERYEGFIFDIWGTLYGGGPIFPGAFEVLEKLAEAGRPVVVLSNAPRVPQVVVDRFDRLGLPAEFYRDIVTSGGEARRCLLDAGDLVHGALGARCLNLGPGRFQDLLPGTRFETVAEVTDADWVLAAGPEGIDDTIDAYEAVLRQAAERDLPLLCANPDIEVVDKGKRNMCAGAMAARYGELGGTVIAHGKPHAPVFERCLEILELPKERVLVVGDNRETDIAGAEALGIDRLLLADGIDAPKLLDGPDGRLAADKLAAFQAVPGPVATWVASRLTWAG